MKGITIIDYLENTINTVLNSSDIQAGTLNFRIEIPPERKFGEFSTNVAMVGAKSASIPPRKLAEKIATELRLNPVVEKIEIAGPGFINIWLKSFFYTEFLNDFLNDSTNIVPEIFDNEKIQVEFVSANPTGPLTVGHGRQAVIGDVLSRVLSRLGYDVTREYYFNDAGKQMKLLARSVWVRYNEFFGLNYEIPEGGYHGKYIIGLAKEIKYEKSDQFKDIWNPEVEKYFLEVAKDSMFVHIKNTLKKMEIEFDVFFSEGSLFTDGTVDKVMALFEEKGLVYEQEGAKWLKVSQFADSPDKVLVRTDGMPTYFYTDIANHYKKHERGFRKVFDIWGADHHGHIPRMKAAMTAFGFEDDFFNVILHQMVSLKKDGETVKMSTRAGNFSTLDELLDVVGSDVTRYFYAMVDKDAQLVFDVDLALSKSMENPVFYVQYAHARIRSLFENARNKGVELNLNDGLNRIDSEDDKFIIRELMLFPEVLKDVAKNSAVHKLTNYVYGLASRFHNYYNSNVFVDEKDPELSNGRMSLAEAVGKIIAECLGLLGIEAPESMRQIQ